MGLRGLVEDRSGSIAIRMAAAVQVGPTYRVQSPGCASAPVGCQPSAISKIQPCSHRARTTRTAHTPV